MDFTRVTGKSEVEGGHRAWNFFKAIGVFKSEKKYAETGLRNYLKVWIK